MQFCLELYTKNPCVVLTAAGMALQFEIDIGASLSLVATYHKFWPNTCLHDTAFKLNRYTDTPQKLLGIMETMVFYY